MRIFARATVAGLLLCVFALTGLRNHLVTSVTGDISGFDRWTVATLAFVENCQTHGGQNGPEPQRHDHSQCCVCCVASGRDLVLFVALSPEIADERGSAHTDIFRVHASSDDLNYGPPGWGSAWSSRSSRRFLKVELRYGVA
ncbi:hypothetical protein [Methylocystis heyeri]|uniref:DUF2946 domain-containing protein n=1 Tax=Methylocystis heyeri TaxID=391905 RepID=A0A6B8KG34_9HYPH|nr:hypothetical protein [Methylocystis heyeri]QGM45453.1 hypothetical protein H2LOC_006955 [Methylocystis heyeri]